MARWQPGSAGRLEEAALALFAERGFDQVTVAEIATSAGLTERTFFRYYADKREVLFGGSALLRDLMTAEVADVPDGTSPMATVAAALDVAGDLLQERQEHARQRFGVIAASTELQERELIKMASLATALAEALRARGVAPMAASLSAEAGIAVFGIAFQQWVTSAAGPDLRTRISQLLVDLADVTASA